MSDILPEFRSFALQLADIAGSIIRPLFRTHMQVDMKADESPVTIADRDAEKAMRDAISQRYPDHGIWGEEFGWHNKDSKYCWVLDPVDGTKSFIAGFPTFGTLISITRLGVPVLGIIDQPIARERWMGISSGTTLNDLTCKTRPCPELKHAVLSTTSPYLFAESSPAFERLRTQVQHTVYGYDCYAYAQLASGHIDLVVETGLKPHDFCALRPVVEGAGGIMTDWQGNPLTLASDGKVIAAGDSRLHEAALKLLSA